ncbi:hypothetical protein BH10ACI1_BH10ACI1_27570 [soil metagenome]
MEFTRRDFVKFGSFAAVAALGLSDSVFAFTPTDVLGNQTAESFRQLIGTQFYISGAEVSTSATLIKVEDFPNRTENGECFSMVFETNLKKTEQAAYSIFHPSIGDFELLLTEGNTGRCCAFIAVINRI